MPAWGWVLIAVAVVAVLAVALWQALARRRTERLRGRFSPEYERVARRSESRSDAEAELAAREERRRRLDIRPLTEAARSRYRREWRAVQAQFVEEPAAAVAAADRLIQSAMAERGYPVEDFEQRAADLSVDHPAVVENYRRGHGLAEASAGGESSTESLRQAMRHYRALFDDLVEDQMDQPLSRDTAGGAAADDHDRHPTGRTVR